MRLMPSSLLARTALIILLALIATQIASFTLFNRYITQPRLQIAVAGFASHLKSISAALESLPPEQHLEFIERLREREGIRVARVREGDREVVLAPDAPPLRSARMHLKREFGEGADLYMRPRTPNVFLVKLPVGERAYWVVFPRNRIERESGFAWVAWVAFSTLVALIGAYLLVRKVNQPLRVLARAAREIGHGRSPPPVNPEGPSEVRAVAAAFNQMREDLARQEKERANFLAGVSHDLRTPLARLRLNIEMLGDKVDASTREGMAADIVDMDAIVGQFLDFGREEAGEIVQSADLNALIREIADRSHSPDANIRTALQNIPPMAMRPVAMRRLIANLVENALKHGTGVIDVTTAMHGKVVELVVADRGPGIPAEEVERIKLPFTRLDSARSGASGAGLGLAIVDRIARLHGGSLDLLAREGGGLEARVTLPLA